MYLRCQSDPLMSFLFLIAAEGLNVMMNVLVSAGLFFLVTRWDAMTPPTFHTCNSLMIHCWYVLKV